MNHEHTMNREHIMNREQGRIAGCREGGFTAIELVVALGIFSVIAIISSVAMINTFAGIRQVSEGTELQVQAQNSAEWVSRLLRYTDQVPGTESAIVSAGPHDITFTTWSGTGDDPDAPYRARLAVIPDADGYSLVSDVAPGQLVDGLWTWSGDWSTTAVPAGAARRILLQAPADMGEPFTLRIFACAPADGCAETERDVTPSASGPIALQAGEEVVAVEIILGDPADAANAVTQRIGLVNS